MKRAVVLLLLGVLLLSATPVGAATGFEILQPTERQTVSGTLEIRLLPLSSEYFILSVEVAHGLSPADGDFREIACDNGYMTVREPSGTTACRWTPYGFGGGQYTLRVAYYKLEAGRRTAVRWDERLFVTRSFVLEASDLSPKLQLAVPEQVAAPVPLTAKVVDDDLAEWRLSATDASGHEWVLATGRHSASFYAEEDDKAPWRGWPTKQMLDRAVQANLSVPDVPATLDLSQLPTGAATVKLWAVDLFGNESAVERKVEVSNPKPEPTPAPEPDRAGPQLGAVVVAPVSGAGLNLRWEAASDPSGIAGYRVFLHEGMTQRQVADLGPDARQFAMRLSEGAYRVELQAVDQAGNTTTSEPLAFSVKAGTVALWNGGRFLAGDVPGFAEEGRTWVPLRLFSEALGYEVTWDAGKQAATLRDPKTGRTVIATVGVPALQVVDGGKQTQVEAAAPRLVGGRVLVPLRALVEALGAKVEWLQETQTVELVTE